jgi:hypothetical protein
MSANEQLLLRQILETLREILQVLRKIERQIPVD